MKSSRQFTYVYVYLSLCALIKTMNDLLTLDKYCQEDKILTCCCAVLVSQPWWPWWCEEWTVRSPPAPASIITLTTATAITITTTPTWATSTNTATTTMISVRQRLSQIWRSLVIRGWHYQIFNTKTDSDCERPSFYLLLQGHCRICRWQFTFLKDVQFVNCDVC